MEAAKNRLCRASRPQEAGFYKKMRKLQRMDGSQDGDKTRREIRASSAAQADQNRYALAWAYRATK